MPRTSKADRQAVLLEIVRSEAVSTQAELVRHLEQRGVACTQVSVSRDIRELGLGKRGGRYAVPATAAAAQLPKLEAFAAKVIGFYLGAERVGESLVVVRTLSGTAHSVALLLDRSKWPGLAGTLAGDDTIFVAVRGARAGRDVVRRLNVLLKG